MGIESNPEINQVSNSLSGTPRRDDSFSFQTTKHLGNFKVQEVRGVQGFVRRKNTPFDLLSGGCQKQPIYSGGSI